MFRGDVPIRNTVDVVHKLSPRRRDGDGVAGRVGASVRIGGPIRLAHPLGPGWAPLVLGLFPFPVNGPEIGLIEVQC